MSRLDVLAKLNQKAFAANQRVERKIGLHLVDLAGGQEAFALFVGAQGGFAGLDQLNVQIPAGVSGVVDLVVSINGKAANVVKLKVR